MEIWTFLKESAIYAGVGTLLVFALRAYIQSQTKNFFDKNIENHKHELTKSLKEVEFDYQRKIQDFTLYTQKRHGIYAELYEKLFNASSQVTDATSRMRSYPIPANDNVDLDLLRASLIKEGFGEREANEVVRQWRQNPSEARRKGEMLYDLILIYKADKVRSETNKFFLLNELYLNDSLSKQIANSLILMKDLCRNWSLYVQFPENYQETNFLTSNREIQDHLRIQIDSIKYQMRKELSIGDYVS